MTLIRPTRDDVPILKECLANLEYVLNTITDPTIKKSLTEDRDRYKSLLTELQTLQKTPGQN